MWQHGACSVLGRRSGCHLVLALEPPSCIDQGRAGRGRPELGTTIAGDYQLCVAACTAALDLQPSCAKALYRRARALTEPIASGPTETESAIRDLTEAARVSPEDKAVRSLLNKLRKERSEQKNKESSTFSGMFGRGEIYDERSLQEQAARDESEKRLAAMTEKERTVEDCEREVSSKGDFDRAHKI